MEHEKTIALTPSGVNDYVEFNLSAGALWYGGFAVIFSDATTFSSKLGSRAAVLSGSVGDYFISPAGRVTVNVGIGNTLEEDIEIYYYYRDGSFDPVNKYSVDYERGILYTHSDLFTGATISYRASAYKISYDIGHGIEGVSYSPNGNVVQVRTESLLPINNLVKVIWTKAPPASDLIQLQRYFTPLIYLVAFRFN
jgi:hypothetical protein